MTDVAKLLTQGNDVSEDKTNKHWVDKKKEIYSVGQIEENLFKVKKAIAKAHFTDKVNED